MRLREWFSWHFPELGKVVTDNHIYTRIVHLIGCKENVTDEIKDQLAEITLEEEKADEIIDAAKTSMGQELSEADQAQISLFSERVSGLVAFREHLQEYLKDRMNAVAPNLTALIGENVGSKLITHSGSLINLAKYPASTIQILGAEKALFRALKMRTGKTPKYGLIFNSTFIGRAGIKNRGKISRYLANKCAIAARIDSFTEGQNTSRFGEKLRDQMEERIKFLSSGVKPKKNKDAMAEVMEELKAEGFYHTTENGDKKKKKKKAADSDDEEEEEAPKKKKDKKDKKSKKRKAENSDDEEEVETIKPKKKKKKTE